MCVGQKSRHMAETKKTEGRKIMGEVDRKEELRRPVSGIPKLEVKLSHGAWDHHEI